MTKKEAFILWNVLAIFLAKYHIDTGNPLSCLSYEAPPSKLHLVKPYLHKTKCSTLIIQPYSNQPVVSGGLLDARTTSSSSCSNTKPPSGAVIAIMWSGLAYLIFMETKTNSTCCQTQYNRVHSKVNGFDDSPHSLKAFMSLWTRPPYGFVHSQSKLRIEIPIIS